MTQKKSTTLSRSDLYTMTPIEPKNIDLRLIDRMVARGRVTQAQMATHLTQLVDTADNAEDISPIVFRDSKEMVQ